MATNSGTNWSSIFTGPKIRQSDQIANSGYSEEYLEFDSGSFTVSNNAPNNKVTVALNPQTGVNALSASVAASFAQMKDYGYMLFENSAVAGANVLQNSYVIYPGAGLTYQLTPPSPGVSAGLYHIYLDPIGSFDTLSATSITTITSSCGILIAKNPHGLTNAQFGDFLPTYITNANPGFNFNYYADNAGINTFSKMVGGGTGYAGRLSFNTATGDLNYFATPFTGSEGETFLIGQLINPFRVMNNGTVSCSYGLITSNVSCANLTCTNISANSSLVTTANATKTITTSLTSSHGKITNLTSTTASIGQLTIDSIVPAAAGSNIDLGLGSIALGGLTINGVGVSPNFGLGTVTAANIKATANLSGSNVIVTDTALAATGSFRRTFTDVLSIPVTVSASMPATGTYDLQLYTTNLGNRFVPKFVDGQGNSQVVGGYPVDRQVGTLPGTGAAKGVARFTFQEYGFYTCELTMYANDVTASNNPYIVQRSIVNVVNHNTSASVNIGTVGTAAAAGDKTVEFAPFTIVQSADKKALEVTGTYTNAGKGATSLTEIRYYAHAPFTYTGQVS